MHSSTPADVQRSRRASYTNVGNEGCGAKFGNEMCERKWNVRSRAACEGYCSGARSCPGYGWIDYGNTGHCFVFGTGQANGCDLGGQVCYQTQGASSLASVVTIATRVINVRVDAANFLLVPLLPQCRASCAKPGAYRAHTSTLPDRRPRRAPGSARVPRFYWPFPRGSACQPNPHDRRVPPAAVLT